MATAYQLAANGGIGEENLWRNGEENKPISKYRKTSRSQRRRGYRQRGALCCWQRMRSLHRRRKTSNAPLVLRKHQNRAETARKRKAARRRGVAAAARRRCFHAQPLSASSASARIRACHQRKDNAASRTQNMRARNIDNGKRALAA
jgi:hypothetical protein